MRNLEKFYHMLFICLLLIGVGCAKTESSNIKTSGFYASYRITGNNQNAAVCSVTYQVGGITGTYIDLEAGDIVTCDGQSMNRTELAGIITYSTNVAYQVGKTYNVVLTRAGEGSYTSSVVLPEEIIGYAPTNLSNFQKGSAINTTWNASSNIMHNMQVTLSYNTGNRSYSFYKYDSAPEAGSGLGFSTTETQVNPPVAGNWTSTIKFQRYLLGSMDASLEGSIRGEQEVSSNITLTD